MDLASSAIWSQKGFTKGLLVMRPNITPFGFSARGCFGLDCWVGSCHLTNANHPNILAVYFRLWNSKKMVFLTAVFYLTYTCFCIFLSCKLQTMNCSFWILVCIKVRVFITSCWLTFFSGDSGFFSDRSFESTCFCSATILDWFSNPTIFPL